MMSSMKINCLNPASLNAVMLNLNQRKEKELDRPCVNMLQKSNDEIAMFLEKTSINPWTWWPF